MQPLVVLGDHRDGSSVDGVALAGVAGVEQSGSRGQLRGHIQDRFACAGQALGHAATESGRAFDRPLAWGPADGPGLQSGHGLVVDLESDRGGDLAGWLEGHSGEGGAIAMVITGYFLSPQLESPAVGNLTSGLITPVLSYAAGGRRPAARYV